MDPIAERKIHFAPLARQQQVIDALLRDGEYRNVTELMRRALDHYLSARGRPPLSEQARQMAEDYSSSDGTENPGRLQDPSRETPEEW